MPRGNITKGEMEFYVYKLKNQLDKETCGNKDLANKYLNKVLDKIKEYRE